MRIANLDNRAALVFGEPGAERALDIATCSAGKFGPDLAAIYLNWEQVVEWSLQLAGDELAGATSIERSHLGPPSPTPSQVFAIGLNYQSHARNRVRRPDWPAAGIHQVRVELRRARH